MSTFKETGHVTSELTGNPKPGVDLRGGYSVKGEGFRLRRADQLDTTDIVTESDLVPIRLDPWGKENLTKLVIPEQSEVTVGMEIEYTVIDGSTGQPKNLYNGGEVIKTNGHTTAFTGGEHWLLDTLGASPEALRTMAEFGTEPTNDITKATEERKMLIKGVVKKADDLGLMLLPTGVPGYPIESTWDNVPPHPYIVSIHEHLRETALDFDAGTIQVHVDLAPFTGIGTPPIELALHTANRYNAVFASMIGGIMTTSPFDNGRITLNASNREWKRNRLSTAGGVQPDYEVDGHIYYRYADKLVSSGEIPVPERAGAWDSRKGDGSHKDVRPKASIGTVELGGPDMHPDIDLQEAFQIVSRDFVHACAREARGDTSLPTFLIDTDYDTRVANRSAISRHGNRAILETSRGRADVPSLWGNYFDWRLHTKLIAPEVREELSRAQHAIYRSMDNEGISKGETAIDEYFDPRSGNYLRGNFSLVMLEFANSLDPKIPEYQRIRITNMEIARCYRDYLNRL